MSQSHGTTAGTHTLLQSMLQRLKLQPGTESQGCLPQPSCSTAALNWGQNGLQTVNGFGAAVVGSPQTDDVTREPKEEGKGGLGENDNPRKAHEMRKWDSREEFGIPAWDSGFGRPATSLKREGQQPVQGPILDRGQAFSSSLSLISSLSHKDNIDSDGGANRGSGQAILPGVSPTGKGELLPAKTFKDADVPSFKRTEDEQQGKREDNDNSAVTKYIPSKNCTMQDAVTNHHDDRGPLPDTSPLTSRTLGQSQDHDSSPTTEQGFTPRVYMWSSRTTEASPGTGSEEKKALHLGNGGLDMEVFPTSQKTTNITSGKTQRKRLSETKTTRWAEKIKERWRNGSLGKKGKEEGERVEIKNEVEFSPQNQPSAADNLLNTSNKEGERTPLSLIRSDAINSPPAPSDFTTESHIRPTNDFELGLGSYSLLEEIVTGQEWAKFLNPTLAGISTNQGSSEQPTSRLETTLNPQDQDGDQSSVIPNQSGGVKYQWNFRGSELSQVSDLGMAPISTDVSVPVSMDISEANRIPEQGAESEAIQSEPMVHGLVQSDMESEDSQMGPEHTAHQNLSIRKPADLLNNSALMSRVNLNRKRAHQSQQKGGERLRAEEGKMRDREEAERDGSISSPRTAPCHAMDEREELKEDNAMISLYELKSSLAPVSPSSSVPAPRGVLKHSISQDSESSISMETVTKKRRVEETRRVHFSEDVITIAPIDLDLGGIDPEEDSGTEEDSVIEEEVGMEQAAREEVVVPAARLTLPAWIMALKRRNTGRKHRQ